MKNILTFVVNEFGTNSYLYIDRASSSTILIDPGGNTQEIVDVITQQKLKLEKIIITHAHYDHIAGIQYFYEKFNVPFVIHKSELSLLFDNTKNLSLFFGSPFNIEEIKKLPIQEVDDKEKFFCGGQEILVLHTPGHTPGSICLYIEEDSKNYLFSGDTLFCGSIGRTDLPLGNMDFLVKSLKKIFSLPQKTTFFPGHGNHCSLESEKEHNPFYPR